MKGIKMKVEIEIPDALSVGFRGVAKEEGFVVDTTKLPPNVVAHGARLGILSMLRDAAADEKTPTGRRNAIEAKYASMAAGETGGRAVASPETIMARLGVNMVAKALAAAGLSADAVKATTAAAIKAADPIGAAADALAAARGITDAGAASALTAKVRKAARAAFDAQNREI